MNPELVSRLPKDVARTIATKKIAMMTENVKMLKDATPGVKIKSAGVSYDVIIDPYNLGFYAGSSDGFIELSFDDPANSRSRSNGNSARSSSGNSARSSGNDPFIMTIARWEWKDVGDRKIADVKIGKLANNWGSLEEKRADNMYNSALKDKALIKIVLSIIYKCAVFNKVSPEDITIDISIPKKYKMKTLLGKYFSK